VALLKRKQAGRRCQKTRGCGSPSNVINLMEAFEAQHSRKRALQTKKTKAKKRTTCASNRSSKSPLRAGKPSRGIQPRSRPSQQKPASPRSLSASPPRGIPDSAADGGVCDGSC